MIFRQNWPEKPVSHGNDSFPAGPKRNTSSDGSESGGKIFE